MLAARRRRRIEHARAWRVVERSRRRPACDAARRVHHGERGIALLGSILILALLAAVTASTLWLTRSELWVAGSARAYLQARYAAEAGVWHALAAIAPGTDFAALVAGTGGLADPGEPGPLPFPGGGFVDFPGPPFGYSVTATVLATERVRLRAVGTSVRGARRTVDATVGRELEPYAPAALVARSGEVTVSPALAGLPPDAGGVAVDARTPAGGAQAIVAAATADEAEAARASLSSGGATLLGDTAAVRARPFDVAAFAAGARLVAQPPDVLAAEQGGAGAPVALAVAAGTAPRLVGHGVLLATGPLEVVGDVDWSGVLYVAGELRLAATTCHVAGLVWAERVSFATGCALRFDPAAIQEADSALRLPRRPTLLAIDDA